MLEERPVCLRDDPPFRCTAALRRTSCGVQLAAGLRASAHANVPLHVLPLRRTCRTRVFRARAASRWLEFAHALWKPTVRARLPSLSLRGRAATCQPRPLTSSRLVRECTRERATARAPSQKDLSTRIFGARAASRWLESVHVLRKTTAPAGRSSLWLHGRAQTWWPLPLTSSRLARV